MTDNKTITIDEIAAKILKFSKLVTEKTDPAYRLGPFSFPLMQKKLMPADAVAVNLRLAVSIHWVEADKKWCQEFELQCLGPNKPVCRYVCSNYNIHDKTAIESMVNQVVHSARLAYGSVTIPTRRFEFSGHIYTARPCEGEGVLIATEEDIPEVSHLDKLLMKGRMVLCQPARYILVNSWDGDLAVEYFVTLKDATAVMLSEVRDEFRKNHVGSEQDWEMLEASYYKNGWVEYNEDESADPLFGINDMDAWSDMDGNEKYSWHIFECQADALIDAPKAEE